MEGDIQNKNSPPPSHLWRPELESELPCREKLCSSSKSVVPGDLKTRQTFANLHEASVNPMVADADCTVVAACAIFSPPSSPPSENVRKALGGWEPGREGEWGMNLVV